MIKNLSSFFLIAVLFTSCLTPKMMERRCAACPERTVFSDSTVINVRDSFAIRDSVYYKEIKVNSAADSAGWEAYFACVEGKVILSQYETTQGSKTKVRVNVTGNKIRVDCATLQDSITFLSKEKVRLETLIKRDSNTGNKVTVVTLPRKIVNILTWWQKLLMGIGIFALSWWTLKLAFWIGRNYAALLTNGFSFSISYIWTAVKTLFKL